MKSNLSNPLFSKPTIWGPCLSGSSKNIWSIAHGKIETTPFQVRAPSPPRGLETPIGPAEDAELGGHGYDSSDCTCHAYHLWKSSCLQWRAHRYHVAPMVKKLTKPCLVVWMDTVWTAKKKKTTGLTNLVTILAAKTIIRWIINHESTMFSTSRSKPGWDDWWDPSFACQCLATWSTPWGLGLGWALRAATTVSAEVCTRKCCRTTPWRWQSLFDWKGIQMMTICMRFIYIYIYMSQISWSLLKVTIVKFPSCRIAQKVNLSQRSKQVHALSHRWIADFAGLSVESRLRLDRIRWGPLFLPKFLPPTKGVTVQGMHRSVISMFARGFWRGKTGKTENSDWVEKTPKHSC